MTVYYEPKTALGKWSIRLMVGCIAFWLLTIILLVSGQRSDTFLGNPALAIPTLLAGISGISAFFTGIIGIIKGKDRSVVVFITTIVGFFAILIVLMEVLFPH